MGEARAAGTGSVNALMRAMLGVALLVLGGAAGARAPGEVTPLFRDEAPLAVTISGPIRQIAARAQRSTDPHAGTMAADGATYRIELSARGVSRRHRVNCRFPPLRVKLAAKPDGASLFHRQSGLKLVTHCKEPARYEQHLLREYAAYRLYNVITPESFRVRLLRVTYLDGGKSLGTKWGFFIEDADDAARRLGRRELTTVRIAREALDPRDAARFALFQYMIGNTDWDMTAAADEKDCCHNVKLLSPEKGRVADVTPLPYDFDNSGLVDAPYAVPNEVLPIRVVTQRHYRGYCALNALVMEEADAFRRARPGMEAVLAGIPGLEEGERRTMQRYLSQFFTDIATPASLRDKLMSSCRQPG